MRHVDFSPLYRSTVGFDRLFGMLDSLGQPEGGQSYPPYNIEKTGEDAYRITMAVAGFGEDELSVTLHPNALVIEGRKEEKDGSDGDGAATFLHRGIATRAFQRSFRLADHIKVAGAKLENGLLHIELVREVPETLKPRTIAITSTPAKRGAKVLENQAAA